MSAGRTARLISLLLAGFLLSPSQPWAQSAARKAPPAKAGAGSQPAGGQGLVPSGLGRTGPNDRRPLDIQADDGIEWQQNNFVYIAHGNARATRGNATVYGDTLIAHYRPAPSDPSQKSQKDANPDAGTGSSDIYRVEADGHVRLETETQTVYGEHAVYDLDRSTGVVTGKNLRLVTPRDTVTARDSLEWYDNTQIAVARGDAVAIQEPKRLAGDVLVAQVVKPPDGPSRISRIDAQGHVVVSTINEIARGSSGVYNVDDGIATLAGNVTITREDNELRGEYGVVDLNRNVSRLLSAPPGAAESGPVKGLIVPKPSSKSGGSDDAAGGKNRRGAPTGASSAAPGAAQ
jgi:lipopolysaccharide export system protein LptA